MLCSLCTENIEKITEQETWGPSLLLRLMRVRHTHHTSGKPGCYFRNHFWSGSTPPLLPGKNLHITRVITASPWLSSLPRVLYTRHKETGGKPHQIDDQVNHWSTRLLINTTGIITFFVQSVADLGEAPLAEIYLISL